MPNIPSFLQPRLSWNPEVPPTPFLDFNISQRSPSQAIHALQELQTQRQATRFTEPAIANPFSLSISPTPTSDSFGHEGRFSSTMAAMSAASCSSYESVSPIHSARPSMIWEQGGIERLISRPGSEAGSGWSTPVIASRSGSPVGKPPSFGDYHMGGQY